MAILRVAFLELLVLVHLLGAAALFRRCFPRESPWLGFVVPIVAITAALNFIEHFFPLPEMGWLLPFTFCGAIWALLKPGYSWEGLRFPSLLFTGSFSFFLLLKAGAPDILNYTESGADLTRVLNYCLGEKLPATDSWMPGYDCGGYYAFQHYGASVLTRLFSVDIGTGLNLSFALLLALLCQMGAAVAFTISGRKWIAVAIVLILAAGSTGSAPILLLLGHADYGLSTDLNTGCDDPKFNPFTAWAAHDKVHTNLTLVAPTYTIYCSEYHANLGATFLTMAVVLSSYLAFRVARCNWPWVLLIAMPMVTVITSAWYFIISFILCTAGLALALLRGRRPENWRLVLMAGVIGLFLVWPQYVSLSANPFTQSFVWNTPDDRTPLWQFCLQWWPIFIPWVILCFLWRRLDGMTRWLHAIVAILYVGMEFVSLTDRSFTVQKMWGNIYGLGLIVFLPVIFMHRGFFLRSVTVFFLATFLYCLVEWQWVVIWSRADPHEFCDLRGDYGIVADIQRRRIQEVLGAMHGATVLPGKSYWAYNLAPLIVTLSGNRCFVAYTFQEGQSGHAPEIDYRSQMNDDFYAGTMTSPLPFLRANDIAGVVIWPEDKIPDAILQQIKNEISSEYYYIDCKADEPDNAGVFLRQDKAGLAAAEAATPGPGVVPPPSTPAPAPAQ
jgi:hypothetical protein